MAVNLLRILVHLKFGNKIKFNKNKFKEWEIMETQNDITVLATSVNNTPNVD